MPILIDSVARQYKVLPFEIKKLPWSEFKEMMELNQIRYSVMGG